MMLSAFYSSCSNHFLSYIVVHTSFFLISAATAAAISLTWLGAGCVLLLVRSLLLLVRRDCARACRKLTRHCQAQKQKGRQKRGRILIPKEHSYWPRIQHASKTIDESSVHFKFHCLIYHRHRLGGFPKGPLYRAIPVGHWAFFQRVLPDPHGPPYKYNVGSYCWEQ